MEDHLRAEAAKAFSQAADSLVDACRRLEEWGLPDPPVERLLQALEEVTRSVHRMHPSDDRVKFETADLASPMAWQIAARENGRNQGISLDGKGPVG